jgi:hypothetical protein
VQGAAGVPVEATGAKMSKVTIEEIAEAYRKAANAHPGPAFSREEFSAFLGHAVSVQSLSNMDSNGTGPAGVFYQGRKKMYLKGPAVEWAIARVKIFTDDRGRGRR